MSNRKHLEQLAIRTVSNDLYYDLCDIIACGGNYKRELKLHEMVTA